MIKIPFLPDYQILLSDKHDGSFRDESKVVDFLHVQIPDKRIGFQHLAHGSQISVWSESPENTLADAVINKEMDTALSLVVGDCFPIILIDPKKEIISIIHGGWRSLLQNIITLTLNRLTHEFRSNPEDLVVWIGPGLRACSNLMKTPPIQSLFPEWEQFVHKSDDGYSVDLVNFIRHSLIKNQIKDENIFDYGKCTYCEKDSFFSHRRAILEGDENGRFIVSVYRK